MTGSDVLLLFQILYVVTAIGTMIIVISENRNPVKTISWVLILLFLPLIGLIIYYFFGIDNRKNRLISHKTYKKINKVVREELVPFSYGKVPPRYKGLVNSLLAESPLYGSSKVVFLNSGEVFFEELFEKIRAAKKFVHIEYYIFNDDRIGNELANLLIEKVNQGVQVRLIYDYVGNWNVKKSFYQNLSDNGVETVAFLPVKFKYFTSRVNYRNHRKIIVIDGELGYVGGMNIANRYVDGLSFGIWRDTQVRIEGSAVSGLQSSFVLDWYSATGTMLMDKMYYPVAQNVGESVIQIVNGSPFGTDKFIHIGYLNAINTATKSILIQTPYFVPTDGLLLCLQLAAKRGVKINLMIPKKADTKLVHIATKAFLQDLINVGIRINLYTKGFLHSKLLIIDDELVITGSVNLDVRSFEHNFEIAAFIYDGDTNAIARSVFEEDLKDSEKLDKEEWSKRKWYRRFVESLMRLFSPLL